jgi:hypothetical protein
MSYIPMASPPRVTLCTKHVPPELVPPPTYAFHDDDVVVTDVICTPATHRDMPLIRKAAVLRKRATSRRPHTTARMSKTDTPMKRISIQAASHTPIKRKPAPQTRIRIPSSSRVLAYSTYTATINNTRLKQPLICGTLTTPASLTHRRDVHNHELPSGMDEIL